MFRMTSFSVCFFSLLMPLSFASTVSTSSPEATKVAMDILKSGGNAVDAACAAVFTLNVTQPYFAGVGGGGFALIHPQGKADVFLDFRESAPSHVTSRLFHHADGSKMENWKERNTGPKTVGIPGEVAGCGKMIAEYGSLSWKKVLEPAIKLAQDGFKVSQFFQEELSDQWTRISPYLFTKSLLQGADGAGLKKGEIFKQPKLALTLKALAEEGSKGFYSGQLAIKWLKEAQTLGVTISTKELAAYRVRQSQPISFEFGKFHGVTAPVPSSAGFTLATVLRYLQHYHSIRGVENESQAERYAAAIEAKDYFGNLRNKKLSDPSRIKFSPQQYVNSKEEQQAWSEMDRRLATKIAKITQPNSKSSRTVGNTLEMRSHTAHVSVTDDFGNAVALTSSVGNIYGSGIILPESGFVLNSTLGDFSDKAGSVNSPAPLVRPLSNMSPFLIYEGQPSDQNLVGVLGAAGGPLIPSGIVDFVQNYYYHNMNKEDAIRSPRIHAESGEGIFLEKHAPSETFDRLKTMGYQVHPTETIWAVFEGVVRKKPNSTWEAVADTRYDGLGLHQ